MNAEKKSICPWKSVAHLLGFVGGPTTSRLQQKELLGRVQDSRAGLGLEEHMQFCSKATREQRKTMVVEEVTRVEQECYLIKAVSQGQRGAWAGWEATMSRGISWADIWPTPQAWLTFLIRTTYDTLPCPRNLSQWFGSEDKCLLYGNT